MKLTENFVRHKIFFYLGVLCLTIANVVADDYLKEAPTFLKPCQLSDPKNGECLANAVQNLFTNWKEGIPGLKTLGSIDPFHVKKVHLEQDNPNVNLKMDLKDMMVLGLSKSIITKASVNNDLTFKFLVKIPSVRVKGDYRMKGSILVLRLDGAGVLETELSDVDILFVLKTKTISHHDHKFIDVQSIQSNIKNIGNFHVKFNNLFNGNAELENSANDVLNQNWRDLFEIMRPVFQETLDAISLDRYKKVFAYVPGTYFFSDLP